ncbi:MAG TPA: ATP-binding protein [Pseudacidobacterium sp.]|jgi:two-component system sensor histidine kinase CpxA|nr:ATP-binding protein [Pseudacidobacterium sp.]
MRTFFLQLFLSFWIATIGIFIGATIFFPGDDPGPPAELDAINAISAEQSLRMMLADYRVHGCTSPAMSNSRMMVADSHGQILCSSQIDLPTQSLLDRAIRKGTIAGKRDRHEWVQVRPIALDSGEKWYLILRAPFQPPRWFPFPKSAFPISILVTFLFAYLLTRPLRALSNAFRSFAAGDLSTRLPVSGRSRWGRFDSADVRTLMRDFNSMADRVTELIEAQKLLVRDISHELRTPLARLRMALELAREDGALDHAAFERMEREADRVNDLIGEMLTLSLLESLGEPPRADKFSMRELIEELLGDANFEAAARGCRIQFESKTNDTEFSGQREMLRRAVENILRNAIRYTPSGGLIEVELDETGENEAATAGISDRCLRISVRDTGPGIPAKHLSQAFRPFYRVDMARSESSGGFGVGLAIAERTVHLHGGKIMASNRPGGGLEVQILLPRMSTHR